MSMTKEMTSGKPYKLILSFAIPLILGNVFQQLYNMVDTVIVGKFVGVNALAGVGSTGAIFHYDRSTLRSRRLFGNEKIHSKFYLFMHSGSGDTHSGNDAPD